MKAAKKEEEFPKASKTPRILIIVAFIVILFFAAIAVYFYMQYQKAQSMLKTSTASSTKEIDLLVKHVDSIIELPKGEQPTIATVSDVTKLKGQNFFNNAKDGDKVLIYQNAKKAFLYRPSTNKIIEVGPVNINASSSGKAGSGQEVAGAVSSADSSTISPNNIRVVLYNGTAVVGLTKIAEKDLKVKDAVVSVVDRNNTKTSDYKQTLVIDLTGKKKTQAQQLASLIGGNVVSMPIGEDKPVTGDILIILGEDYASK